MKFLVIILYILLLGCSAREKKADTNDTKINSFNTRILGKWGEESPVMRIDKDSVFFFHIVKAYPYELIDRDIIIDCSADFGRKDTLGGILITADTIGFFLDNKLWTKRYRFK